MSELSQILSKLDSIQEDVNENKVAHEQILNKILQVDMKTTHLNERVGILYDTMNGAGGEKPMPIRLSLTETRLDSVEEDTKELKEAQKKNETSKKTNKTQIVIAAITGFFLVAAAVVSGWFALAG